MPDSGAAQDLSGFIESYSHVMYTTKHAHNKFWNGAKFMYHKSAVILQNNNKADNGCLQRNSTAKINMNEDFELRTYN